MVIGHQKHLITSAGYAIAFVLALVPVGMTLAERHTLRFFPDALSRLGLLVALATMLGTFAIAADWGRYTYLFAIHTFAFAASLRAPDEQPAKLPLRLSWVIGGTALLLLYTGAWNVHHFAPGGDNPLVPGFLFKLFPGT
jgi:hypothetical protein